MGLVYADIEIINVRDKIAHEMGVLPKNDIRQMTVRMNVDTGAIMLALNETIVAQLGLPIIGQRTAQMADGSPIELNVTGPVEVRYANRDSTVNALVLPGDAEPLFGAMPMEEMDLIVDPARQELSVHPLHPIRPVVALK